MNTNTTLNRGAADLLDLIEAYAEARHRQGHSSYNAQTSAALQAVKAALAAGQATAAQAVAEPADTVVLNAAMRAIQQAIELIGAPTDERMRAVRRVLRGAVIVAEDDGKVAPLPTSSYAGRVYEEGFLVGTCPLYTADQMRAFADATCALRASRGQAPAGAYTDSTPHLKVGDSSFESWYAGYVKEGTKGLKQHCRDAYAAGMGDPLVGATPTPQADSVQEDAACWHWLAEYLVGTRTDLDDEIVASETVNDLRNLVKAAIKQGANHDR